MDHFFEKIPGWWSVGDAAFYGSMVERFPSGSHFVEIGSWQGRSTASMAVEIANSGKEIKFDCIDTWKGSKYFPEMTHFAKKHDVFAAFKKRTAPVAKYINAIQSRSTDAVKRYKDASLDFVFLDGAHDACAVRADINAWWPKLKKGGILAGHDYDPTHNPDVVKTVNEIFREPVEIFGRCWAIERREARQKRDIVYVGLPGRPGDSIATGQLTALFNPGTDAVVYDLRPRAASLLPLCFNHLWCEALNERPGMSHFCMMHSDIVPEPGWLNVMMGELHRTGADILSVVIPVKDDRGMTSTGLMRMPSRQMNKFSLKRALKLPKTFCAADVGGKSDVLLINTGLWVCDFTRPWVEKMCFRFKDRIIRTDDGKFIPQCIGEDWLFGIDAARLGLKVYCTTKVKAHHQGIFMYPNCVPWGTGDEGEGGFAWNIDGPEIYADGNASAFTCEGVSRYERQKKTQRSDFSGGHEGNGKAAAAGHATAAHAGRRGKTPVHLANGHAGKSSIAGHGGNGQSAAGGKRRAAKTGRHAVHGVR